MALTVTVPPLTVSAPRKPSSPAARAARSFTHMPWVSSTAPTGCDSEWMAPRPFWKAVDPICDAASMCARAVRSRPSFTARERFSFTRRCCFSIIAWFSFWKKGRSTAWAWVSLRTVSPLFPVPARLAPRSSARAGERPRVLLMLNPGKRDAVALAAALASLDLALTITVGKDADFREAVIAATAGNTVGSIVGYAIGAYGATTLFTSPTAYRRMLATPAGDAFATLRKCVSAGETLPLPVFQAW